jgi:tripartite-type tricarboxylate transporter receptor subunit TctC
MPASIRPFRNRGEPEVLKALASRSILLLSAAALFACPGLLMAQGYPNKPVKIVVPYAAGGGADTLARAIGQRLGDTLGQPFVIDNKPGAGGISATEFVAKSPADGYTMLLTDTQFVVTPALFTKLPYDPRKDLKGVSLMTVVPLFIAVKTSDGIGSLKDLIALIKANPGKFSYGSAGVGSLHHIAMESLKHSLDLDIVHVPYKGSAQSVTGFLSGDVKVLIASFPTIIQHVKAGTVKLLAATSLERLPEAADVPAVSELLPGFDYATEIGMLVPAGTPPDVVAKLSTEIARILKEPDMIKRVKEGMGAIPVGSTSEAYTRNLDANLDRYAKAVKLSGAKVD